MSIITETASFFLFGRVSFREKRRWQLLRARIHRDLSYIDLQLRVLNYFLLK